MRKIASLDGTLLTKEQTIALKLHEQPYLIIIPQSFFQNHGIDSKVIEFDLVLLDEKISLLGPKIPNPSVMQSTAERIVN
jgi:hypothetical protein